MVWWEVEGVFWYCGLAGGGLDEEFKISGLTGDGRVGWGMLC